MRKRALGIVVLLIVVAAIAASMGSRTDSAEVYRPKAEEGQVQPQAGPATPPPAIEKTETPSITLELADSAVLTRGQTVRGTTSIAGSVLQVRLKSAQSGQLISQSIPVSGPGGTTRGFSFVLDFDAALVAGSQGVLEISEESGPNVSAVRVIREVRFP